MEDFKIIICFFNKNGIIIIKGIVNSDDKSVENAAFREIKDQVDLKISRKANLSLVGIDYDNKKYVFTFKISLNSLKNFKFFTENQFCHMALEKRMDLSLIKFHNEIWNIINKNNKKKIISPKIVNKKKIITPKIVNDNLSEPELSDESIEEIMEEIDEIEDDLKKDFKEFEEKIEEYEEKHEEDLVEDANNILDNIEHKEIDFQKHLEEFEKKINEYEDVEDNFDIQLEKAKEKVNKRERDVDDQGDDNLFNISNQINHKKSKLQDKFKRKFNDLENFELLSKKEREILEGYNKKAKCDENCTTCGSGECSGDMCDL